MSKDWELSGTITRVIQGVSEKTKQPYQMVQVGGHSFFLEPELFDGYVEGEQVVVHGTFVRDVRGASGRFEPVHVLDRIERVNGKPIPRVEK